VHRILTNVDEFARDAGQALRTLRLNPGFGAAAILTLAIGIGANAAMFSVIHHVLLQPLAYPDSNALVFVGRRGSTQPGSQWLSLPRVELIGRSAKSFAGFGAYLTRRSEDVVLSGAGEPEVLRASRVSANFLDVLRVRPQLGRSFLAEEDVPGAPRVAMISAVLWKRRFGGRSIDGLTATLDTVPHAVVGVLPDDFRFPFAEVDVWLPQPNQTSTLPPQFRACCVALFAFARLKPGTNLTEAQAELDVLSAQYEADRKFALDKGPVRVVPLKNELTAQVGSMLWLLMAAVGCVLLIVCANVATLLMTRATSRARELGVRTALGASPWRLVRQLLTESVVLAAIGGALGLVGAWGAIGAVARVTIVDLPRAAEIHVSGLVLAFTMALTVATGVVFGLWPALQVLRPGLLDLLRHGGATSTQGTASRWALSSRAALVVLQVSLSMVLLVGAALMLKSLGRLAAVDTGFASDGLLTMRVPLPSTRYDSPEKRAAFLNALAERVAAQPAVRSVAIARDLPTTGTLGTNIQIVGQPVPEPGHLGVVLQTVTPGFFQVLGVSVTRGREFTAQDDRSGAAPVVIVNESFARRFWPSAPGSPDPLGEKIVVPVIGSAPLEVVGVVDDVRHGGLTADAPQQFYVPNALYPPQSVYLAVRAVDNPSSAVSGVRAAVRAADPQQAITDVRTMDDVLQQSVGRRHLTARLLSMFAGVALLLALLGLYGVLAYSVAQRTDEIGIRRALGAGERAVLGVVVGQALRLTLVGVACGLGGAYAATRALETLLFEVSATDPATFIGVAVLFVLVALLAAYVPARRATRIDPMSALRV
jgi:predicted permease